MRQECLTAAKDVQGTASVLIHELTTITYTFNLYVYLVLLMCCLGCVYALHWLHLRVTFVTFTRYVCGVHPLCLLCLCALLVAFTHYACCNCMELMQNSNVLRLSFLSPVCRLKF